MRVGPETRKWPAGKVTIFCDATEHEVWNRGTTERVVLVLDFRNADFGWRLLNLERRSGSLAARRRVTRRRVTRRRMAQWRMARRGWCDGGVARRRSGAAASGVVADWRGGG
jgi:hypothetical protein